MNSITLHTLMIERTVDSYYITSEEFFTIGMGKTFGDALKDFGDTMERHYVENGFIPDVKKSKELKELRKRLRYLFAPTGRSDNAGKQSAKDTPQG